MPPLIDENFVTCSNPPKTKPKQKKIFHIFFAPWSIFFHSRFDWFSLFFPLQKLPFLLSLIHYFQFHWKNKKKYFIFFLLPDIFFLILFLIDFILFQSCKNYRFCPPLLITFNFIERMKKNISYFFCFLISFFLFLVWLILFHSKASKTTVFAFHDKTLSISLKEWKKIFHIFLLTWSGFFSFIIFSPKPPL